MPTKAKLEHQLKSLKIQLANVLAVICGTSNEEVELTELHDLYQHYMSRGY